MLMRKLFAQFPKVLPPQKSRLRAEQEKFALVEALAAAHTLDAINLTDGVRLEWDYGWGLVRASNTTPCLTLRFEGDTEQDLAKVADQFRTWLGKCAHRCHSTLKISA